MKAIKCKQLSRFLDNSIDFHEYSGKKTEIFCIFCLSYENLQFFSSFFFLLRFSFIFPGFSTVQHACYHWSMLQLMLQKTKIGNIGRNSEYSGSRITCNAIINLCGSSCLKTNHGEGEIYINDAEPLLLASHGQSTSRTAMNGADIPHWLQRNHV